MKLLIPLLTGAILLTGASFNDVQAHKDHKHKHHHKHDYCEDYTTVVFRLGKPHLEIGTVCKTHSGEWRKRGSASYKPIHYNYVRGYGPYHYRQHYRHHYKHHVKDYGTCEERY